MYPDKFRTLPSKRTPWIIMEPGKIFIMGRSITENPGDIYRPVFEWVSKYVHDYSGKTKIELGFEYINTSSTKWIYSILKELSEVRGIILNCSVTWYYEQGDDDMCELGLILKSLNECPIVVVEVEEMSNSRYVSILSGLL